MASTVQVKGLKELNAALAALPKNISRNVLRGAVGAGAKIIRDEAKVQAARGGPDRPDVLTGQLVRSIYHVHVREQSSAIRQVWKVGVRKGKNLAAGRTFGVRGSKTRDNTNSMDAFYARWVEFGHYARRRNGKLVYASRGRRRNDSQRASQIAEGQRAGEVTWIPGQPFLRPAWESKRSAAVERIAAYIRERLPKEVAKLKAKGIAA